MNTCENCKEETLKVAVVSRSLLHLKEREREFVDEKYYCTACKKEFAPKNLLNIMASESFKST